MYCGFSVSHVVRFGATSRTIADTRPQTQESGLSARFNSLCCCWYRLNSGGGRGIRTPVHLSTQTVFKTAGFNHSPIPPLTKLACECVQNRAHTLDPTLNVGIAKRRTGTTPFRIDESLHLI